MSYSTFDPAKATVLAEAKTGDGTTVPWAIRSGKLTYIGEIPFAYISANDRYLAFCDMLYDVMDKSADQKENHRALVRLEDVGPDTDPDQFKAIVDYLHKAHVPFSFALIPVYTDPNGYYNGGVPQTIKWKDRPEMQKAVKYALSHGGNIVMHGYTHQYSNAINPYSGVSGDDFEFYMSHIDENDYVIYDGAVPEDSASWALGRIKSGLNEIKKAGFKEPKIFEYPHYAGSPTDSRAIAGEIKKAYHRGIYFSGGLGTDPENLQHSIGQFFPYEVKDIYGWDIIPENLGNYEPESYNHHPIWLSDNIINSAKKNLVIRDGVASFFFHPYYPLDELKKIVEGIKAAGYKFVDPDSL